jgi:hypothetical protein
MAAPLLEALASSGNRCLALTDDPSAFVGDVETLSPPDNTHPWHQKRHVLKCGLERAKTAYWMEGDSRPLSSKLPIASVLSPGIHSRYVRNLYNQRTAWRSDNRLPVYLDACRLLGINEARARSELRFIDDTAYAISRDPENKWRVLFDLWDRYALWLRDTSQLTNDGTALGLCSHVARFPVHEIDMKIDLVLNCQHLASGDWRLNLDETKELP